MVRFLSVSGVDVEVGAITSRYLMVSFSCKPTIVLVNLKGRFSCAHSFAIFVVKDPVSLDMKSSRGKKRLQFRL